MKKTAKKELFYILKALVDKRVPKLRSDFNKGAEAVKRIAQLQTQICNSQQYICNNRYDRSDAMETMSEIAEYESEIARLRPICTAANFANTELKAAKEFYSTYDLIDKSRELEKLRMEYRSLENRVDKLDDLIFNCEVNMNPFERSLSVCEQAAQDMESYREEYSVLTNRMQTIMKEIHKLNGR